MEYWYMVTTRGDGRAITQAAYRTHALAEKAVKGKLWNLTHPTRLEVEIVPEDRLPSNVTRVD